MSMTGDQAYALSKKYVQETLEGAGALKGKDGESAYQIAVDNGFVGSEADWIESLKGESGLDGTDGFSPIITKNINNTDSDYRLDITDIDRSFTTPNLKGKDGADGLNGFSPTIEPNAGNNDDTYKLDITDENGTFTTDNLKGEKGEQGIQGIQGVQGDKGETGQQGIQGIQGEKGDDGYPFLIYKEYKNLEDFKKSDFPEIGLMFMINTFSEEFNGFPVYRYTGEIDEPYSYITSLSNGESIKGDKGDKGDTGEQGIAGVDGKDGTTYTPTIGAVESGETASATVEIDKDTSTAKFNFILPKGDKGDKGIQGDKGDKGDSGQDGDTPYIKDGTWWYGDTDSGVPIPAIEDLVDYVNGVDGIEDTPVGHILTTMANNAPKHYLKCDGAIYNIGDYPYLEQHFVEEFGSVNKFGGNGTTTFAVPDLRGEFLRGTGTNGHANQGNGSNVGTHQDATTFPIYYIYENKLSFRGDSPTANNPTTISGIDSSIPKSGAIQLNDVSAPKGASTMSYAKVSSRPTNTSVLYCIKYEPTYFVNVSGSGGGGDTENYQDLKNKPKIEGITLEGNRTLNDLGIQPKGDYSLIADTGYELGLSIDPTTYIMTLELKNATGTVISSKTVDFPLESMVIGAYYSDGQLILSLQNGKTLEPIDISNIVRGLVSDTFTIAGIDMKDDITVEELKTALGVPTKVSELENDEKFIKKQETIELDYMIDDNGDLYFTEGLIIRKEEVKQNG